MGGSESKHSSRSDVLPNMQYALNELMLWRERGIEEKCSEEKGRKGVFGQFGKLSPPPPSEGSSGSSGSGSGMMMASKPTSDTSSDSNTSGSESLSSNIASGIGSMASAVGSSAASAMSSLRQAPGTSTVGQQQEDVGTVAPLLQQQDATSLAAADRADGEVIRDKYHFILHHIQKLVTAAEENYMMLCKENWIKNQTSKINLAQAMGPTTRAELERKLSENSTELMKQLGDYDNARMAIQWLQRHFELLVQRRSLGREITHINMRIAGIQKMSPSEDTLDELRHLRGRLQQAHIGVGNAVNKAQQLRRESLAVGLQYLDINHSGGIEPSDQPQISAEMFSRLDVRNKHRVTANDLQMAVQTMEKNIDNLTKEIFAHEREVNRLVEEREKVLSGVPGEVETDKRRVQAEELSVEKKKKEDTINQLQIDRTREEAILRDTYSMFQKAFVESLFNKLGDAHADRSRYEALGGEMENIERNMKNLHIAADRGKQELAASKLSASPGGMSRKSPQLFGRRRMGSSATAASDTPSSTFGSLLSRNKSGSGSSNTSGGSAVMTSDARGKDSSISDTTSGSADSGVTGFTRVTAPDTTNTKMSGDNTGSGRSNTSSPDREGAATTNINMDKTKDTNTRDDTNTSGGNINEQQQQQSSSMKGKSSQQSQQPQAMRQQQRTHSGGDTSGDDSAI